MRIESLGPDAWNTANIRGQLARALGAMGRFEEAERDSVSLSGMPVDCFSWMAVSA